MDVKIFVPEPKCYLSWSHENMGIYFSMYRYFNWFQRKMLKWCFGLEYHKAMKE